MSDNLQVTVMELLLEDITDSESLSTIDDDLEKAIRRKKARRAARNYQEVQSKGTKQITIDLVTGRDGRSNK
jgi:hypothetical protein